jgi:hypothetical protein
MPAGWPYFAWIDPTETVFGPEHLRWDEQIFSFELKQEEGNPANLTLVVVRPDSGLLAPGRKIWCWFAFDCGPDLIRFRGRLVGIPTSIFETKVTLEFVAKPIDMVAQKAALADTLRVLPYYDEAVIDKNKRDDPDVVLEGYTKIWHFDRETHVVTVSDEISGEDGQINFLCSNGDILFDGLSLNLASGPLSRVDVNAEYTWTQQATGTVDLTQYLYSHWPGVKEGGLPWLTADDWPKPKAGLGDGWEVAESTAIGALDFSTHTETKSGKMTIEEANGGTTSVQWTSSSTGIVGGPAAGIGGLTITNSTYSIHNDLDDDGNASYSASQSVSASGSQVVVQYLKASLVAGYKAQRECKEKVSFTLFADVQPIVTDPQDGEALRLDNIRSVNLSGEKDATDPTPIIDDPRRRSYIATARGNQSIEHLITFARAHLMKRARVVEISFAPKLARMPEVTLRKNALVDEPRIGQATGKIIGYSVALDGSDGAIKCEVKIGCTIGYGGGIEAVDGTPTYCTVDYAGADYQVFTGRVVVVPIDTSVGYAPPVAAPNDDGLDFLSALTAQNVIEVGLTVEHGPDPEQKIPKMHNIATSNNEAQNMLAAREAAISQYVLPQFETRAKFKLKSMTRAFETNYDIQVTDLMIPTGYDLEAAPWLALK